MDDTISKHDLLDRAKAAVGDRGLNYGKPEDNFNRIAEYWNAHLKNRGHKLVELDATDVAIMCTLLKLARIDHQPGHLDSWVDVAGYAACGANICCKNPGTKIRRDEERSHSRPFLVSAGMTGMVDPTPENPLGLG